MDKESFDKLVDAIEEAGFEARRYSGRAVYGRFCLGIECSSPISCVMQIVSNACENADEVSEIAELCEALSDPSTDNMGRDAIVYWSSIPWLADEDDGDGDDGGVEVCTEEYEDAHGRKPRGDGQWAFHLEGKEEPIWFNGDYRECKAKAVKAANEQGVELLMVGT